MSIFPTKILLATDGSKEAELAFASAADLSEKTGSELYKILQADFRERFFYALRWIRVPKATALAIWHHTY